MPKYPREITSTVCGKIIGMPQEEFPSGLFYHVGVLAKSLSMAGLECFEPGRGLSPLGVGGSSQSSFGVVLPIGMLSTGSGKGCHLLGPGDHLGAGEGEAAAVGCSSMGEVFCHRTGRGNRDVCPNRR